MELERKDWSAFKSFMSVQKLTFKYEEYKMAVEGAYDNMMVAMNENEEIKIVECQVCVWILSIIWISSKNIKLEVEFGS